MHNHHSYRPNCGSTLILQNNVHVQSLFFMFTAQFVITLIIESFVQLAEDTSSEMYIYILLIQRSPFKLGDIKKIKTKP